MINPLAIATRGRLSTSAKRALTYASLGWIVISGGPTPPVQTQSGDGARKHEYVKEEKDNKQLINHIMQAFILCQED